MKLKIGYADVIMMKGVRNLHNEKASHGYSIRRWLMETIRDVPEWKLKLYDASGVIKQKGKPFVNRNYFL